MDIDLLIQYVKEYKQNFAVISKQEIYKWQAVKCFRDNWNIEADDFYNMFSASTGKTGNLLTSGKYFPLQMILEYSRSKPEEIRKLFRILFDENMDLFERIVSFQSGIKQINEELSPDKNTYQDQRAILVYLNLRYPERYFFYKFKILNQFSQKFDLPYLLKRGSIENYGLFSNLCNIVKRDLTRDQELIKLHFNRLNSECYTDDSLNILTQDFIYAVVTHLDNPKPDKQTKTKVVKKESVKSSDLIAAAEETTFKGRFINYTENNAENKRLGYLGELWVLKYERENLNKAGKPSLINKVIHVSNTEGDGTGYDILSCDETGKMKYIEVKTTTGNKDSLFYISHTELERSKKEGDNYHLYRLYNFNEEEDTADLYQITGDLSSLCLFPVLYKVKLKKKNNDEK